MTSREDSDRRDTTINLVGAVLGQGLLAATGVMLARGLGPTDRGYVALLLLVPTIVLFAGSLGVPLSITFALARAPSAESAVRSSLLRIGGIQLLVLIPLSAVILAAVLIGKPEEVRMAGLMAPAILALGLPQLYGAAVLQGLHRFTAYNLIFLAPLALYAVSLAALLVADALTVASAVGAYTATLAASAFGGIFVIRRMGSGHIEDSVVSPSWMLRFGVRGMLGSPDAIETLRLDQAVIALFLSPAALGIYAVAVSFTNLPRFIARSVGRVAYPRVAGHGNTDDARSAMWRYFWVAMPLYGSVAIVLLAAAPWLVDFFFGSAFSSASTITRILLISSILICARLVLSEGARGAGYPTVSSIAEVAALVALFVAAGVLVPEGGTEGVAWALVVSSVIGLAVLVLGLLRLRGTPGDQVLSREDPAPATIDI